MNYVIVITIYFLAIVACYALTPFLRNNTDFIPLVSAIIIIIIQLSHASWSICQEKKLSLDMQRKLITFETKARNIHEIYPKLFELALIAISQYGGVFNTIKQKLNQLKEQNKTISHQELNRLILEHIDTCSNPLNQTDIANFCNYFRIKAALYSSKAIEQIIESIIQNLMSLFDIIRRDILESFNICSIEDFDNLVSKRIDELTHLRDSLKTQINCELNCDN